MGYLVALAPDCGAMMRKATPNTPLSVVGLLATWSVIPKRKQHWGVKGTEQAK
jgi:hypothetical protein